MAGLVHDKYCRHRDNCDETGFSHRGECGNCLGHCEPCNEYGLNCGEWQDCECSLGNSCGDGHTCKRYIDIEFTLEEFPIQGAYCCQNSPPLAQPCGGGFTDENGDPLMVPVEGNPSGWNDFTGLSPALKYPATTHKIRLTRTACGCFWGGYWSSSCDMLRCCEDASEGHHICGDGACVDELVCEDCDPEDDPCANIDDGWASSLDDWGDGGGIESGGVAGALCIGQGCTNTSPCDYTDDSCSDPNQTSTRGCKKTGNFKPFHIEAFMQHFTDVGSCNGEWQLEIRGQTLQIREQASVSGSGCDFSGSCGSPPNPNPFGCDDQYALFRGRWQGWDNECAGYWGTDPCTEIYHEQCHLDEFAHVGCACPQEMEFESTVVVDSNLRQLHPTFKVFDNCNWRTCMSEHIHCNVEPLGGEHNCLGDDCYGTPTTWCGYCEYCAGVGACDGNWNFADQNCHGALGCDHPACLCDCCDGEEGEDPWCKCTPPSGTDWLVYDYLFPCSNSRCVDPDGEVEQACEPCNESNQSRLCTDVTVKITPNNNPKPYWVS